MSPAFSHMAGDGSARMVDVTGKSETARMARAQAVVLLDRSTLDLLRRDALPKGDVLTVAKVAGIMAAKRTSELIPMCHPLPLTHVGVECVACDDPPSVRIESEVSLFGRTGVEMEALVAVQVAAATVYDMCKAVQRDIVITDVRLLMKSGGKSGTFVAGGDDGLRMSVPDASAPADVRMKAPAVAVVTLSDGAFAGSREDASGPALLGMLTDVLATRRAERFVLPDDPAALRPLLTDLAAKGYDLIVTTGGTGLSPRDLTPEAVLPLLTRRLPGLEQAMTADGLSRTPRAALSRCLAGCIGASLVLALPGSARAALEGCSAVLAVLPHALEKLAGDMRDCGG